MKAIKFIAIFAMIIGITATSCKKEETHMVKNNVPENKQDKQQKYLSPGSTNPWGPNWKIPNNPQTEDCISDPQTCYDDVIVRPEKVDFYRAFVEEVTSSSEGVVRGFSNDVYREIMPELEPHVLHELTSGQYYMHHIVNVDVVKEYLLVLPSNYYVPGITPVYWMFRFIVE